MNKSITQANQNDKQISESIKRFFIRFHISSSLKASNAYKKKGIPVVEVFQYLFWLNHKFCGISDSSRSSVGSYRIASERNIRHQDIRIPVCEES